MAPAAWPPSGRQDCSARSPLLALALLLVAAAFVPSSRPFGFIAPAARHGGSSVALAARRGGQPTEVPEAAPASADAARATPWDLVQDPEAQLRDLLARVFKLEDDGSSAHTLKWVVKPFYRKVTGCEEGGEEGARAAFRVALKIPRQKQTIWSGILHSQEGAEVEAAKAALARRVLRGRLQSRGSAKQTLHHIFRKALMNDAVSITTEARDGVGYRSSLELPRQLFAVGVVPEGLKFEGQGSDAKESGEAASLRALLYICGSIAVLPPLKALSDGITEAKEGKKKAFGRGTNRVFLKHLSPETREETVREQLEQYGQLTALDLEECQGSATYEHALSAWTAEHMLDRGALDGRIISVEQEQGSSTGGAAQGSSREGSSSKGRTRTGASTKDRAQKAWGKSSKERRFAKHVKVVTNGVRWPHDAVLYFNDAPTRGWSVERMCKQVQGVSWTYLVDAKTNISLGKGSVGFTHKKAAEEALSKFKGKSIKGWQVNLSFRRRR